jgi:UDP-glucose 4-epimerase
MTATDDPPGANRHGRLVALTGATGFIGRHLARELPRRGYRIRVLLRRPVEAPLEFGSAVIGDLARPQNLSAALADVDAVIHTAGVAHGMSGVPADDYRLLNTEATIRLAQAAERAGVKRFVFLSSVRAQAGPSAVDALTEEMAPAPTDDYGRSKLAAEHGIASLAIDWVALRLVLTYGPGVAGNMARLIRLARTRLPLPLGALAAERSILALDNLASAVDCVLAQPAPLRRPLLVADPVPLTIPQMIAAMRRGLGRAPLLFPVPPAVLGRALTWAGRIEMHERLARPLVARPAALQALGWTPAVTSEEALAQLMRGDATRGIA